MPQLSELRFGVVLAVGRGTAVLDEGQRSPTGRGRFGVFCSPFSQWEMPFVADGEMFPIRMQKIDSISVRHESSIRALFGDTFGFNVKVGVYETFAKQNHLLCQHQHSIPSNKIAACAAITGFAAAAAYIPYLL